MTEKKIYSAFISSAFNSLRDERNTVINNLLDFRVLPIGMEHFTVSTTGEFSDIEELIDDSDFFIVLLGSAYGSCDENGVSWTEREYLYALTRKKPILAIICDELSANLNKNEFELSEDELKQLRFCKSISFAREITEEFSIKTIMGQFFNSLIFSKCIGWTRIDDINKNQKALEQWNSDHKVYDLSGIWYHVHLSDDDDEYIRIGTIKIEQDFSPNNYQHLTASGENYSIIDYDTKTQEFSENEMKKTKFVGDYTLQENGEIFGIYNAHRFFKDGRFSEWEIEKGRKRGLHDFSIDVYSDTTERISGEFHDEAPSPKFGNIFLFRNKLERNAFILKHRGHIINQRQGDRHDDRHELQSDYKSG